MLSRTSLLALCTVALLLVCGKVVAEGGGEEDVDESDVLVLTDQNFDQVRRRRRFPSKSQAGQRPMTETFTRAAGG